MVWQIYLVGLSGQSRPPVQQWPYRLAYDHLHLHRLCSQVPASYDTERGCLLSIIATELSIKRGEIWMPARTSVGYSAVQSVRVVIRLGCKTAILIAIKPPRPTPKRWQDLTSKASSTQNISWAFWQCQLNDEQLFLHRFIAYFHKIIRRIVDMSWYALAMKMVVHCDLKMMMMMMMSSFLYR